MGNEILFTAHSPLGYSVVLSSERFYNHITSAEGDHNAHTEFSTAETKKTIEKPEVIYEGTKPDTDVYFARSVAEYPRLFLKVVVNTYPEGGDVSTAFLTKSIAGGIKDGGIKYVSRSNEL